jgi:hypothetical protein
MFELSLGNISHHAYVVVAACVRGVQPHTETVISVWTKATQTAHWSVGPHISFLILIDEFCDPLKFF